MNGVLVSVKRFLAFMPATVGRVELINTRTQVNLNGEILEPKLVILKKIAGVKRGAYRQRRVGTDGGGKIVSSVPGEVDYNGDRYIKLTNGTLLPEKWRDILYEWYAGRIAQKAWRDGLASTAPVTMIGVSLVNE